MTKAEFIKNASSLGYCTKAQAGHYCTIHDKDEYTEEDYEGVFRYADAQYYRDKTLPTYGLLDGGSTTKRYYRHGGSESDRE